MANSRLRTIDRPMTSVAAFAHATTNTSSAAAIDSRRTGPELAAQRLVHRSNRRAVHIGPVFQGLANDPSSPKKSPGDAGHLPPMQAAEVCVYVPKLDQDHKF